MPTVVIERAQGLNLGGEQRVHSPPSFCRSCGSKLPPDSFYLGRFLPCNRFEKKTESIDRYDLNLNRCLSCTLIQIEQLPPVDALCPRVPWLNYREPELHLDDLILDLSKTHSFENKRVIGVGPFDEPFLTRVQKKATSCERVGSAIVKDSHENQRFPYLETIQDSLSSTGWGLDYVKKHGAVNWVVCRYLLEHCQAPLQALINFRTLLSEDGMVLLEVPDSLKFLKRRDYSFLWEEHACYFTEASLINLVKQAGYALIAIRRYEGLLEDALVVVIKPIEQKGIQKEPAFILNEENFFNQYQSEFPVVQKRYQDLLSKRKAAGGGIVIFGAGHQAIMFINALQLTPYLSYVVDDHPGKKNCFVPGTSIPIVSLEVMLKDTGITLCLLSVSPLVESKVLEKCSAYLDRGGEIYSIFSGSLIGTVLGEFK